MEQISASIVPTVKSMPNNNKILLIMIENNQNTSDCDQKEIIPAYD